MTVIARHPIIAALGPWLEAITGRPCGRLQSPPNRPYPYNVLYNIPGGSVSGPPLTAPEADVAFVVQVNSVSLDPGEVENLADGVRAAFLERHPLSGELLRSAPELDGWVIHDRELDAGLGNTEYSGAPPNRVFTTSERYILHATPTH